MSDESRVEDILTSTIEGSTYDQPPQSRVESLLIELKEAIGPGGSNLFHICSASEYDPINRVPIIQDPQENVFYLVPGGSDTDLYTEWIWVNNAWEEFGTGGGGVDGVTFTPSVSEQGVISWTNDGGRQNPSSVNLVTAVLNALPTWEGGSY